MVYAFVPREILILMPKHVGIIEGEIVLEFDKIKPKEFKRFKVILKCTSATLSGAMPIMLSM
jgi:hypothetical protein